MICNCLSLCNAVSTFILCTSLVSNLLSLMAIVSNSQCFCLLSYSRLLLSHFGNDGAAVMAGSVRGVATRLKKDNPNIIAIHCIKYRLALGVSQAAKSESYLKKFGEILVTIFILQLYIVQFDRQGWKKYRTL